MSYITFAQDGSDISLLSTYKITVPFTSCHISLNKFPHLPILIDSHFPSYETHFQQM